MPITLVEYLPKKFLQNHSENEMKEEVVQCYMVSVDDNEQEKIDNSSQPLGETKEAMKEDTSASISKEEKREEESSIEIPVQCKSYLKSLKNSTNPPRVKYDILAHLRHIPALLSVYNALQLSEELRRALILALLSPDVFKTEIDWRSSSLWSISVWKTSGLNKASMRALLSSSDNWKAS
uniref:Uncharacterized protein n=1 Tax=Quercus lobata TaxID=97700 RepID=A0A7N2MYZ7_QUELO